jgi:hypothetical protein
MAATGLTMPSRAGRRLRRTETADVSGTEPESAPGTTRHQDSKGMTGNYGQFSRADRP